SPAHGCAEQPFSKPENRRACCGRKNAVQRLREVDASFAIPRVEYFQPKCPKGRKNRCQPCRGTFVVRKWIRESLSGCQSPGGDSRFLPDNLQINMPLLLCQETRDEQQDPRDQRRGHHGSRLRERG